MTDPKDSTPAVEEAQAKSTPAPSTPKEGEPSSGGQPQDSVSTLLKALEDEKVRDAMSKIFQSEKDRGVNRAQEDAKAALAKAETMSEELASLAKYLPDISPEQLEKAKAQADTDAVLAWARKEMASQTGVQDSTPDVSGELKGILLAHGMDASDTGVKKFLQENAGDDTPARLNAYLAERKANQPSASAASTAPPASSTTPGSQDAEEIGAKLVELSKNPTQNFAEMKELEAQLAKLEGGT